MESVDTTFVNFDQLKQLTGYKDVRKVQEVLEMGKIPYFPTRIGVWTTMELINEAGRKQTDYHRENADELELV